jgi:hypothetical protein
METTMKKCTKCGEEKPLEMFSRHKTTKDGRVSQCKNCDHIRCQAWRDENRDKTREYSRDYREANLERVRRRNREYARRSDKNRQWQRENCDRRNAKRREAYKSDPEKYRECSRAWRMANPEKVREMSRRWQKANTSRVSLYYATNRERYLLHIRRLRARYPDRYCAYSQKRRARIANVGGRGVTAADIQAMIYCQMGLCAYCERDGQKLTLDHIVPIDQNGLHDPDNCCMACGICNSSKSARTPEQWVDRWYLR